jgi:hypothetical protein
MLALIAIAALVGAALLGATLALRFNVFALVPTTIFLLAIVAIDLLVRGDAIWWVGVAMFATAASLQLGYFAASLLQILLPGMGRPTPISGDRQTHPAAPPLAPGQPDRNITIEGGRSSVRAFPTDRGDINQFAGLPPSAERDDPARRK